jgi:hypothetical protein
MRRNLWLLVSVCGLSGVLMASRCAHDQEAAAPAAAAGQSDDVSVEAPPTAAVDSSATEAPSAPPVDPGVEDDPLGDSFSQPGESDLGLPEDSDPTLDDGSLLDDPTFEPEAIPDEPVPEP